MVCVSFCWTDQLQRQILPCARLLLSFFICRRWNALLFSACRRDWSWVAIFVTVELQRDLNSLFVFRRLLWGKQWWWDQTSAIGWVQIPPTPAPPADCSLYLVPPILSVPCSPAAGPNRCRSPVIQDSGMSSLRLLLSSHFHLCWNVMWELLEHFSSASIQAIFETWWWIYIICSRSNLTGYLLQRMSRWVLKCADICGAGTLVGTFLQYHWYFYMLLTPFKQVGRFYLM